MLKSIGVTDVTEAPSAEMAWSYLVGTQRRGFHAVIADLGLPGISGIKLIKKLRAMPSPRAKELPIIVVTGTNDLTTFKKLEAQNISSYLIKPISAGLLQSAIEKALAAGKYGVGTLGAW